MSFEENINAILIHIVFINTIVSCKWKLLIFIHFCSHYYCILSLHIWW